MSSSSVSPIWCIMPVLNNLQMSLDAIGDCLDQSVPTRVLVINQGSDDETRKALEQTAEQRPDRLFVWTHLPPLPSLAAAWNRGLDMVWEAGGTEALVVNNDIRISRLTVGILKLNMERDKALFISAVGVTEDQYAKWCSEGDALFSDTTTSGVPPNSKGGPDFSCFLISKAGHLKYRFDENFIPLFCEDLDTHRRYMLGGDGDKIFSINLPYLHLASQTLKRMDPEARARKERQIGGSRNYYQQKWGGAVNEETYYEPFKAESEHVAQRMGIGATTPELQRWWQESHVR
jgi:glycosyltransferase involved in cell wall biosynthesis